MLFINLYCFCFPRQLATATAGIPLFEIFLTVNKRGEYKQQVCFLYQLNCLNQFSYWQRFDIRPYFLILTAYQVLGEFSL
jgi:hypothetical protein